MTKQIGSGESAALATVVEPMSLINQAPSDLPAHLTWGDRRGTENVDESKLVPHQLRLAQSGTPETKRSEQGAYLEGLREGDFFDREDRIILGEGPLRMAIVHYIGSENVLFDSKELGVVLERNLPDSDPRCQFTYIEKNGVKESVKPEATKFHNYLALVGGADGTVRKMAVSLKGSQLKTAGVINDKLNSSKLPAWAHLWQVTSYADSKKGNSFYGWRIERIGYANAAICDEAELLFKAIQGKTIVVNPEAESTASKAEVADPDIPF